MRKAFRSYRGMEPSPPERARRERERDAARKREADAYADAYAQRLSAAFGPSFLKELEEPDKPYSTIDLKTSGVLTGEVRRQ